MHVYEINPNEEEQFYYPKSRWFKECEDPDLENYYLSLYRNASNIYQELSTEDLQNKTVLIHPKTVFDRKSFFNFFEVQRKRITEKGLEECDYYFISKSCLDDGTFRNLLKKENEEFFSELIEGFVTSFRYVKNFIDHSLLCLEDSDPIFIKIKKNSNLYGNEEDLIKDCSNPKTSRLLHILKTKGTYRITFNLYWISKSKLKFLNFLKDKKIDPKKIRLIEKVTTDYLENKVTISEERVDEILENCLYHLDSRRLNIEEARFHFNILGNSNWIDYLPELADFFHELISRKQISLINTTQFKTIRNYIEKRVDNLHHWNKAIFYSGLMQQFPNKREKIRQRLIDYINKTNFAGYHELKLKDIKMSYEE